MKRRRPALTILFTLALALALSLPVLAAGIFHPPCLAVLTEAPPGDLTLTVHMVKNGATISVPLAPERRGWEVCYNLYREGVWSIRAWYGNSYDFQDAVLLAETGGRTYQIPITPDLVTERANYDLLTLHTDTMTLTHGAPPWREPLLLLGRVALALLIEGVLFRLYGYRDRRSWVVFLLCNLATEVGHNLILSGKFAAGLNYTNYIKIYLFLIPVVLLVEFILFVALVEERSRDRTAGYILAANGISQVVELVTILTLPI